MLLSGAWGKAIHEKNLKQKISWHCPFKGINIEWTEKDNLVGNLDNITIIFDF